MPAESGASAIKPVKHKIVGLQQIPDGLTREIAAWARQLERQRLSRARGAAGQWQVTIGAITGFFGLATLVTADDVVGLLKMPWNILYGVGVALALLSAGASVYYAASGAEARIGNMPKDIAGLVKYRNQAFEHVRTSLWRSRFLLLLAFIALIFAFGVRWYAPMETPQPAQIEITSTTQSR